MNDDGDVFDIEKYRSIGVWPSGKHMKRVIRKDRRGSRQVEHDDGRLDAHIVAPPSMRVGGAVRKEK